MNTSILEESAGLGDFLSSLRLRPGLSDVHLISGVPRAKEGGRYVPLVGSPRSETLIRELERDLSDDDRMRLQRRGDVTVRRVGDFGLIRAHLYREQGQTRAALRLLDATPPRFSDLGLPDTIRKFAAAPSGLVFLTGPVGVGKSSSLGALIREMDEQRFDRHARIIESPTEWIHEPKHMIVTHVNVGSRQDADSYASAVSSALRSDAQVIVIGELFHDDETIAVALEAAVSGLLVFATLHAATVSAALQSLIDAFPPDSERRLRQMLADSLRGAASLRLVPRVDAVGRAAAAEVMVTNDAIRSAIRAGEFAKISGIIHQGENEMQSLETDLNRLISTGRISARDAKLFAANPRLIAGE